MALLVDSDDDIALLAPKAAPEAAAKRTRDEKEDSSGTPSDARVAAKANPAQRGPHTCAGRGDGLLKMAALAFGAAPPTTSLACLRETSRPIPKNSLAPDAVCSPRSTEADTLQPKTDEAPAPPPRAAVVQPRPPETSALSSNLAPSAEALDSRPTPAPAATAAPPAVTAAATVRKQAPSKPNGKMTAAASGTPKIDAFFAKFRHQP